VEPPDVVLEGIDREVERAERHIADAVAKGAKVLYASGEEPTGQIADALKRIRAVHKNLLLFSGRSVDTKLISSAS